MQFVHDKYYIWYNRFVGLLGLVLLILTVLAWTMPAMAFLKTDLGFHPAIGGIGLIQLLYSIFFYRKQDSAWTGALINAMIWSLANIGLIHNSGQFHSWFLISWCVQVFLAGMFGLYTLVGCDFMVTIYYVLMATGPGNRESFNDPFTYGALLVTYFVSTISYAVWRSKYVDQESQKVRQLSGQLKSKQQQSEILIQSITDGMVVINTEGQVGLMNPAAAQMTQWPIEEAAGIDVNLVIKFQDIEGKEIPLESSPFKEVFGTSKSVKKELQLVGREGKKVQVSLVVSPVLLPNSNELTGAIAIIRDITVEREEEKRRADFISTASHEMRTPVAAIEGYLALALNDKVSSIDSKARGFIEKAHSSTQHLGKLFQDLLTSAKAEDGRLVSHPVVVEMGEYIEQLAESLRFSAEKKGLLMDFVIGGTKDASNSSTGGIKVVKPLYYAYVDPDRMREVITNLFDNGVKYTETGKISIGLTGNNDVVQLFIRDTGPGIPAEDIPHLFQKFYRVDNSATRTIGGTGLGLFICRKIVELYSGRIWVESELKKGSTFYINLPRISSQKAAELQAAEASKSPELSLPST